MMADTIGFSRMEIQIQPILEGNSPETETPPAEARRYPNRKICSWLYRLKLMNYTAEAGSIRPVLTQALKSAGLFSWRPLRGLDLCRRLRASFTNNPALDNHETSKAPSPLRSAGALQIGLAIFRSR